MCTYVWLCSWSPGASDVPRLETVGTLGSHPILGASLHVAGCFEIMCGGHIKNSPALNSQYSGALR